MLTLGADVEFLVRNRSGELVSSEGLIGGSKHSPLWVRGGNLQEDNVLAEMAITPASTMTEWLKLINGLKSQLNSLLRKKKLLIDISASAFYPEELLTTFQAKQFGCEPDYDAWEVCINESPNGNTNLRSAGGHVHIGMPSEITDDLGHLFTFTKWLDLYLGVPSVLVDKDKNRRTLYGKAGSFRPKEYGLEYRTLSNFWVAKPSNIKWVWKQVHKAYDTFVSSNLTAPEIGKEDIYLAINSSNVNEAADIVGRFNLEVPSHG